MHVSRDRSWNGSRVRSARTYWRARLDAAGVLPCFRCGRPVSSRDRWQVEHITERALGGDPTDHANQWVSHGRCNEQAGGQLAQKMRQTKSIYQPRGGMTAERARGIRGI